MITVLKGSPQYTIDSDGIVTISTTWMCLPENGVDGRSTTHWLTFQSEVESFVGSIGDAYKCPVATDSSREITKYVESNLFKVQDITWKCVDGRTHYEVTFTNLQNVTAMRMVGNVSAEIDSNGEKTKSIRYVVDVSATPDMSEQDIAMLIDGYFIESGTTVNWANASYLVESSSYQAQSRTRYEISISAKDMSAMLIGLPTEAIDGYGQRTLTAIWRYSKEYYEEEWEKPAVGSDAYKYVGGKDGYLISSVSEANIGVLGYQVTYTAVHVSKMHLHTGIKATSNNGTEYTINYKGDSDSVQEFINAAGMSVQAVLGADSDVEHTGTVGALLDANTAYITDVSVTEQSKGNFSAVLTAKSGTSTSATTSNDVTVTTSASKFDLEPSHCGWASMVNGMDYFKINFPPSTVYRYDIDPATLLSMAEDGTGSSSGGWTASEILTAIQTGKRLGYDSIVGVYDSSNVKVDGSKVKKLSDVSKLKMQGYVYALPFMKRKEGRYFVYTRNNFFEPWVAEEEAPVFLVSPTKHAVNEDGDTQLYGMDVPFKKKYIGMSLPMVECSVTMRYKGKTSAIFTRDLSYYYDRAVRYVKNTAFTSYKGAGISTSETVDDSGTVYTEVTCTLHILTKFYWNPKYTSHEYVFPTE